VSFNLLTKELTRASFRVGLNGRLVGRCTIILIKERMIMKKNLILAAIVISLTGCSSSNLSETKKNAKKTWGEMGFNVIGYEGYQYGFGIVGVKFGGAKVWYTLEKKGNDNIVYSGFLQRWGDEYHMYSIRSINAVSGH